MDTSGLEGATSTASASARASRTPGPGRASSAPTMRMAVTGTEWRRRTNHSWNPTSRSASGSTTVTRVRSGSSVTGSKVKPRSQARVISPVTSDRVAPSRQAVGAVEVGAQVAVAQVEPVDAAVAADHLHGLPGLVPQPPPPLGVDLVGDACR